ncbi:MAG: hypothetical protein ACP5I1_08360, partial [Candidatus Hinthialibacter sp.]
MLRAVFPCLFAILFALAAMDGAGQDSQSALADFSDARLVKIALLQQPSWTEGDSPEKIRQWQMEWIIKHLDQAGQAHADIACLGEGAVNMDGLTLPD